MKSCTTDELEEKHAEFKRNNPMHRRSDQIYGDHYWYEFDRLEEKSGHECTCSLACCHMATLALKGFIDVAVVWKTSDEADKPCRFEPAGRPIDCMKIFGGRNLRSLFFECAGFTQLLIVSAKKKNPIKYIN